MTVETVLQNVLLEIGLDVPNPQVSGDSYEMRQVRKFINDAGKDIARRTEWSLMKKDWLIAGNVLAADLPPDFQEMVETGAARINREGYHPIRAVVDEELWGLMAVRPSSQPHYHLSGGRLLFSPTLPPEGAVVRYISSNWVEGRDHVSQNGDNLLIPERLVEKGAIWRWKRQKGLPFDDVLAEFEADLIADIKADRGEA